MKTQPAEPLLSRLRQSIDRADPYLDRKGLTIGHHDIGLCRAARFRTSQDIGSQLRIAVGDCGRLCSSLPLMHTPSFLSVVIWSASFGGP